MKYKSGITKHASQVKPNQNDKDNIILNISGDQIQLAFRNN